MNSEDSYKVNCIFLINAYQFREYTIKRLNNIILLLNPMFKKYYKHNFIQQYVLIVIILIINGKGKIYKYISNICVKWINPRA